MSLTFSRVHTLSSSLLFHFMNLLFLNYVSRNLVTAFLWLCQVWGLTFNKPFFLHLAHWVWRFVDYCKTVKYSVLFLIRSEILRTSSDAKLLHTPHIKVSQWRFSVFSLLWCFTCHLSPTSTSGSSPDRCSLACSPFSFS